MSAHLSSLCALAAENWQEVVGAAIGIVIFIGSMVVSALKQSQARRRLPNPPAPAPTEPRTTQPAPSIPTADELALRRRAQLDQLMRRRREEARRPAAPPAPPRPDNLTTGEAQQRQRAVEQYRRRAEELRGQRQASPAAAQQQRQEPRRSSPPPRGPQQPAPRHVAPAAPVPVPAEKEATPRLVPQAAMAKVQHAASPLAGLSLRRAFIVKEILDSPLALRDPA